MLDPVTKFPENHVKFSDLAGRFNNYSYESRNYGVRTQKTAENYSKFRGWNSAEAYAGAATTAAVEDEEVSGVSTPPLWRASPPRSPQHRQNYYRSLSPSSRAQAIARGQRELMDMVSRMPEGCYELSLKDIVEVEWPIVEVKQETSSQGVVVNGEELHRREIDRRRKSHRKAEINRTGSINNGGFLLKMVFPVSFFWGSRNKKKKNSAKNDPSRDGRVSPRPLLSDGPANAKGLDEEWWKNRLSESAGSESAGFSSNNSGSSKSSGSGSSSSRNSSRHMSGGCCFFMFTKKGKRVVD